MNKEEAMNEEGSSGRVGRPLRGKEKRSEGGK